MRGLDVNIPDGVDADQIIIAYPAFLGYAYYSTFLVQHDDIFQNSFCMHRIAVCMHVRVNPFEWLMTKC